MGQISRQIAVEFQRIATQLNTLRAQARNIWESVQIPRDVKSIQECEKLGLDPLHAAYASMQNFVSLFSEGVSTLDACDAFCRIIAKAEDEYLPGSPPMSPLTLSYFTTWAFFDVRFGPDLETIGTCLLDTAPIIGMDDAMLEIVRRFEETRMGIYECQGMDGSHCILRELVRGLEFQCHVSSGYTGTAGELWFVRLCPPLFGLFDYHVVFNTPYILLNMTKDAWTAYLKKSIMGATDQDHALHEFLKFGPNPNHWNEFIFQAYHHHQSDAIFLSGLPDVRTSLPHGDLAREP
jgi:hypothetical protein